MDHIHGALRAGRLDWSCAQTLTAGMSVTHVTLYQHAVGPLIHRAQLQFHVLPLG